MCPLLLSDEGEEVTHSMRNMAIIPYRVQWQLPFLEGSLMQGLIHMPYRVYQTLSKSIMRLMPYLEITRLQGHQPTLQQASSLMRGLKAMPLQVQTQPSQRKDMFSMQPLTIMWSLEYQPYLLQIVFSTQTQVHILSQALMQYLLRSLFSMRNQAVMLLQGIKTHSLQIGLLMLKLAHIPLQEIWRHSYVITFLMQHMVIWLLRVQMQHWYRQQHISSMRNQGHMHYPAVKRYFRWTEWLMLT